MSKENEIIEEVKDLLPLCNTLNGYHFDYTDCTINKETNDINSIAADKFPAIDIEFIEEICEDQGRNTVKNNLLLTMVVDCFPKQKNVTRENIDNIIDDIKKFFGVNNTLNGKVFLIWYDRYKRYTDQMKGQFYMARITFKVRYFQDKQNP